MSNNRYLSKKSNGKGKKPIVSVIVLFVILLTGVGKYVFGGDSAQLLSLLSESETQSAYEQSLSVTQRDEFGANNKTVEASSAELKRATENDNNSASRSAYKFRNDKLLTSHFEKHGIEMGFSSKADYERAACEVITSKRAISKYEREDNDMVYYIRSTGEIVFLSADGYIRTYFLADEDYFNRQ